MHILVISGPNLNLLGRREPHIYGAVTLDQIHAQLQDEATALDCTVDCFQSNHEGALLDFLQANMDRAQGALLNPGGLTQHSVSLHDAIKSMPFPVIEVHLSNIHARDPWRSHSIIASAARGQVAGLGWLSYLTALRGLVALLRDQAAS
ncbi:MAG TPA: type II 3-dehydroquinate dehydratase [Chloroflexota bacterium]|nr:type II 3-dehydroquinate dehydratase [Chloroflexota bacterium]